MKKQLLIPIFFLLFTAFCYFHCTSTYAEAAESYCIKVNKAKNCVTVYKQNKKGNYTIPVKAMICSCGSNTPEGTFYTPARYRWHALYNNDSICYGQYCTRISGHILFHSIWYYRNGDPSSCSAEDFNKLGKTASHGCVRLTAKDAKWIYKNCSLKTKVIIYSDSSSPGPLGKPKMIKLKLDQTDKMAWDPTDPNKKNPWRNKKPKITGVKAKKTIQQGASLNLMKGVKGYDTCGVKKTKQITITIKQNGKLQDTIDTDNPGIYTIRYRLKDTLGRSTSKKCTLTIKTTTTIEQPDQNPEQPDQNPEQPDQNPEQPDQNPDNPSVTPGSVTDNTGAHYIIYNAPPQRKHFVTIQSQTHF